MNNNRNTGKLAVILHADVAGSTELVHLDEQLAHERIQATFQRFSLIIGKYQGRVRELRGDALLGEFKRASDAVCAALAFQAEQNDYLEHLHGPIKPSVRIGIAMGEVIIADDTITGAGVVLAQRLEQLTLAGGVGIQGAAYETIPARFPFDFDNLGEHQVKGFDNPVRLYTASLRKDIEIPQPELAGRRGPKIKLAAGIAVVLAVAVAGMWYQTWQSSQDAVLENATTTSDSKQASIVVLPFDNLSDDSSQTYFAHGITEDITTDLSRISGLFVISRNSAFTYAGKAVDTKLVSRDLGVGYVLEGSVRRVGDLLRINVQLIDGKTGGHLWANRYDGAAVDVFVLQDKVIKNVVSALSLKLDTKSYVQRSRTETTNPRAYDAFLKGWSYFIRRTPQDYAEAVKHFKRAISLDPDYSRAYAALASTYWEGWERWWYKQLGFDEWIGPRHEAEKFLEIALKEPTALAHQVASEVYRQQGRHADMVREAETAVQLEPNNPNSYVGLSLTLLLDGDGEGMLQAADRAMNLDPQNPAFYLYLKGMAHFSLKQYKQAAEFLERALELNPANFSANNFLIPSYAYLGRLDEAKERVAWHHVPISIDWMKYYYPYKSEVDWDHFANGLRKAGVPEIATKVFRPPDD